LASDIIDIHILYPRLTAQFIGILISEFSQYLKNWDIPGHVFQNQMYPVPQQAGQKVSSISILKKNISTTIS